MPVVFRHEIAARRGPGGGRGRTIPGDVGDDRSPNAGLATPAKLSSGVDVLARAAVTSQQEWRGAQRDESDGRRFGDGGKTGDAWRRGYFGSREKRGTLDADVEIDDAVVVDVDLPVVIEVAVEPAG